MQTINYHGWTVNMEPTPHPWSGKPEYVATNDEVMITEDTFHELLDMIYERTYDLKTN